MRLLHICLVENATVQPNKIALQDEKCSLSYQALLENVLRLRRWLLKQISPGARVALLLENSPELVTSLYAIPAAGLLCVPLETTLHERNLSYILQETGPELLIGSSALLPKVATLALSKKPSLIPVEHLEELLRESFPDGDRELLSIDPKTPAVILYTTGTTGPKKGVLLSHLNLMSATRNIIQFMQLGSSVVESLPMPLSHSFGFARLRSVFEVGGTLLLERGLLRPEHLLQRMERHHANAISSVPAGFSILLDRFEEPFKAMGPALRSIEIGSAFMRRSHKEKLMALCPNARICMHYGLTEASRTTFIEFHSEKEKLESVGKPSPHVTLMIADEEGRPVAPKSVGEILVKGETVMQGYWNQPELSKRSFINGWFRTGDLGLLDGGGYLHLMGRKEEIINLGGLKVAPGEVEEVLLRCPGVAEAAVVGLQESDEITDETVKAFVVLDREEPPRFLETLQRHCLKELEPYKVPTQFEVVPSLPKTASGKIQRQLLKEKEAAR